PNFSEIDLNTTGSFALLILAFFAAGAVSFFVYRKTIPPVSSRLRFLLMSLRAAAVMLVILLLFEPILSITRKKQEKPIVAVLVDNSASMGLVDQKMNRPKVLNEILASDIFNDADHDWEMQFYPFSHKLSEPSNKPPDSLKFTGDGTDIQRSLEELKENLAEKYFASVILITDGADNLGENPARYASTYGIPIFPVAVGDPSQQKDVLISNYATNEIAYADTKIPVDVYIKSSGFQGKRIPVNLIHKNITLDSKVVTLSGSELEQKVRLHVIPKKEGLFKYEIKLPQLEGELTHMNNAKSFYVKVLKSKMKILVIAGGPSSDYSFLKRALQSDENIEIQTFVEKSHGLFYQGPSLPSVNQMAKFDCLILLDFPRRGSSRQSLDKIKSVLSKGKPGLFLPGKNVAFDKLLVLKNFIPLAAKPAIGAERLVYVNILPQGMYHPLCRLSEDEFENKEKWQELPPIFSHFVNIPLHPNTQVLASIDLKRSDVVRKQSLPLITVQRSGIRKSVAVFAYGLWRWDLLMWGVGKTNDSYQRFIRNSIRWLITQEDSKLVRITSNKEIYRSGEEVKFTAQVYFEDYRPVEGAEVVVRLTGAKETQELTLSNIGEGRYEGSFQVLQGGDYQFSGTAHLQGRLLGRDTGKFSVEEFSLEYLNTRMNEKLLKRIASESGGEYFTSEGFSGLREKLNFPEKFIVQNNEWEIWNKTPLLIMCVALLSAEWFIRKRKGML
ncbi:MAG: hypothetical protein ACE5NG_16165, partial [bacterium]